MTSTKYFNSNTYITPNFSENKGEISSHLPNEDSIVHQQILRENVHKKEIYCQISFMILVIILKNNSNSISKSINQFLFIKKEFSSFEQN